MSEIHLQRFLDAQHNTYERALNEIEAGRKTSHWMWYVFPQAVGLGLSPTSMQYAIGSVAEAKAFLDHPILGERYRRIVNVVWEQVVERGLHVHEMFGLADDAKLVSSLTLFAGVAGEVERDTFLTHAGEILQAAYEQGLGRCIITEEFLTT